MKTSGTRSATWERRYETGDVVPGGRGDPVKDMVESPTRT